MSQRQKIILTVRAILLDEYGRWRDDQANGVREEGGDDLDFDLICVGAMGAISNVLSKILLEEDLFLEPEGQGGKPPLELAREIALDLMTDGTGQKADQLVLWRGGDRGRELGGWSMSALVDRLVMHLDPPRSDNRQSQIANRKSPEGP